MNVILNIALTLSKPASTSLFPRTSPTPAKSVTGLLPIGSATKFLCFCEVLDIFINCEEAIGDKCLFSERIN